MEQCRLLNQNASGASILYQLGKEKETRIRVQLLTTIILCAANQYCYLICISWLWLL